MNIQKGFFKGLYFEVQGKGQPMIFLHGIGGSHHMFEPQVKELQRFYKTITIDLKGSGNSESVKTTQYLKEHVNSILELMKHLDIENAIFVGLSYGGIVAQTFAIQYPNKVKKMILIDSYAQTMPKDLDEIKLTLLGAFVIMASWVPKKILKKTFERISPYKKWELAQKEMMAVIENHRTRDVTVQLWEVFNMNILSELNVLSIPTLVIVGDGHETIYRKSKEIMEHLTNGEFLVVRDSVDPTNLCQPEIVNQAILNFTKEAALIQ